MLRLLLSGLLGLSLLAATGPFSLAVEPASAPPPSNSTAAGSKNEGSKPGEGTAQQPSDAERTGKAIGGLVGMAAGAVVGASTIGSALGAVGGFMAGAAAGAAIGAWLGGQAASAGASADGTAESAQEAVAGVQAAVAAASPSEQAAAAQSAEQAVAGAQAAAKAAASGGDPGGGMQQFSEGMSGLSQAAPAAVAPMNDLVRAAAQANPVSAGAPGTTTEAKRANAMVMGGFADAFPDDGELRAQYAKSLLSAGDNLAAVREGRRAIELDPENVTGFSTLSRAQFHVGDYSGARESAQQALDRDPRNPHAAAVMRFTDGRTGPRDGSTGMAVDPSGAKSGGGGSSPRSFGAMRSLRPDEAMPKLLRSARSSVSNPDTSLRLAQSAQRLLRQGDAAAALKAAERALELDPANDTARYYMAMSLIRQGRLQDALKAVNAVLEHSPRDARFLAARARIYNLLGRHAEALADAEAALRLRPDDASIWISKAWALDALGRLSEALNALAAAAGLDPKYRDLFEKAKSFKPGELAAALSGVESNGGDEERSAGSAQAPARGARRATHLALLAGIMMIVSGLAGWWLKRRRRAPWLRRG